MSWPFPLVESDMLKCIAPSVVTFRFMSPKSVGLNGIRPGERIADLRLARPGIRVDHAGQQVAIAVSVEAPRHEDRAAVGVSRLR